MIYHLHVGLCHPRSSKNVVGAIWFNVCNTTFLGVKCMFFSLFSVVLSQ